MGDESASRGPAESLAHSIRARKAEIVAAWERQARPLSMAAHLDGPVLASFLPDLVDEVAEALEHLEHQGGSPRTPGPVRRHAMARHQEGFDLGQVIAEYALLRDCLTVLLGQDVAGAASLRPLHLVLDRAVGAAAQEYTRERERTLEALDHISAAALESRTLPELLERLLRVFLETAPSVDTAAILLREGDELRTSAAVGLDDDIAQGFRVRIGEGLAGRVAAERSPISLASAAHSPLASEAIRARGTRALYAVPLLVDGGELIGVAHMGSLSAYAFSEEDKRLFQALAIRATAGIYQHRLREETERLVRETQLAVRTREQVLAVVSHDLRSPLSTIKLGAGLVLKKLDQDEAIAPLRRQVEAILRATAAMERLLGDLLDMASIQAGRLSIRPGDHDLTSLVDEAVEVNQAAARDKSVRLEGQATRQMVRCDRERILEVLANLVGNAIKFCRPGDWIQIQARPEGDQLLFVVEDSGPGIPAEALPHVFEPFWSATPHEQRHGTGLGLHISRGIVEAHGGRIWVASTPGQGTRFLFTVPAA